MISVWDGDSIGGLDEETRQKIGLEIDMLGIKSAEAQKLNGPITSLAKLLQCGDQKLIVFNNSGRVSGFLKFGAKKLFFFTKKGKSVENTNLCLLDFFVDTSLQRQGIGIAMFNHMLEITGLAPVVFAYDRPSPKLLEFLRKHFGLVNPDMQPNRFVIYEGFPLE